MSDAIVTADHDRLPVQAWASLRTSLGWIYEGEVAKEMRRISHDHSRGYWVWLLRKGEVRVGMGARRWSARAGQWMVTPRGLTRQDFSADAEILSIHFECQWPTGENLFSGDDAEVFDAPDFPALEKTGTRLRRLVDRHFPGVRTTLPHLVVSQTGFLRFHAEFMRWLDAFCSMMRERGRAVAFPGAEGDARIFVAARTLNEASLVEPFPIGELVRNAGLGRPQLDRLFFKAFGVTTRSFWERRRLEAAKAALAHSGVSVKELSFRLGFKQASHFTKWFGQHAGSPPEKWRGSLVTPPR